MKYSFTETNLRCHDAGVMSLKYRSGANYIGANYVLLAGSPSDGDNVL